MNNRTAIITYFTAILQNLVRITNDHRLSEDCATYIVRELVSMIEEQQSPLINAIRVLRSYMHTQLKLLHINLGDTQLSCALTTAIADTAGVEYVCNGLDNCLIAGKRFGLKEAKDFVQLLQKAVAQQAE